MIYPDPQDIDCDVNEEDYPNQDLSVKLLALILLITLIVPMIYIAVLSIFRNSDLIYQIIHRPTPAGIDGFLHF